MFTFYPVPIWHVLPCLLSYLCFFCLCTHHSLTLSHTVCFLDKLHPSCPFPPKFFGMRLLRIGCDHNPLNQLHNRFRRSKFQCIFGFIMSFTAHFSLQYKIQSQARKCLWLPSLFSPQLFFLFYNIDILEEYKTSPSFILVRWSSFCLWCCSVIWWRFCVLSWNI